MLPVAGQGRAVIEGVYPEIDGGKFAIKRVIGESVFVEADIFADGHSALSAEILYRAQRDGDWSVAPMTFVVNDRWQGSFPVNQIGPHCYTIRAWVDHFKAWYLGMQKRIAAGQDVGVELLIGAELIEAAGQRAKGSDAERMQRVVDLLQSDAAQNQKVDVVMIEAFYDLVMSYPGRDHATTYEKELPVYVDRKRAGFSTWYEIFPRSTSPEPGRPGTFKDLEARLPDIAAMGFDVVYLPPIHPIGETLRKGKNNKVQAEPGDVGSPWAIGGAEGGHKAIHPELGTLKDFHSLVSRAQEYTMEIALDVAFQCSPDHPWVKDHPSWFRHRPDGTIQYAENPPKKYQDIYPINFETEDWHGLWEELRSVFLYWIEQGVHIFRVDNPHTKSFSYWEWNIRTIREQYPGVIFLSEAFTRPKVMHLLAKLGFTQSYTYFTWRNAKWELTEYLASLTQTEVKEFFRPNFWPNTPDILHATLQHGGEPAFKIRLILAATMTANYGMYGPAYELLQNVPREPGSEEYLDSEKYQIREWDLNARNIRDLIGQVNRIRHDNAALQSNDGFLFHPTDNEQIICYSKQTPDQRNRIVVVASLDPFFTQRGWVGVDVGALGLDPTQPYRVHDLLSGASFQWDTPGWNYVELDPSTLPAHIFRL